MKPTIVAARPASTSASYRLGDDAVQRQQTRAISADAEERRMSERDDAGIAEDQVERERKQRQPHDVGHDQETRGKQKRASEREAPEHDLAPVPLAWAFAIFPMSEEALIFNAPRCGRTGRWDARSGSRS